MTDEKDDRPPEAVQTPPEPIDVESVLVSDSDKAEPEPKGVSERLKSRMPLILGGILAILIVAFAGLALIRRTDNPENQAVPPAAQTETPAPVEIAIPETETPLAGEKPDPTKIFNSADPDVKAGLGAIDHTAPDDAISELPPPPEFSGANDDLQNAAKDAAKKLAPAPSSPDEIDLSSPDAADALEKLQQGSIDASAPPTPNAAVAPVAAPQGAADAPALEVARLTGSLDAERQHTERQAAEISRLSAELARVNSEGSPLARSAELALVVATIGEKARNGAGFERELEDYERLLGAPADPALIAAAADGLQTLAELKQQFPAMRDSALAAARRERAKGPMSRLTANMASMVNLRPAQEIEGAAPAAILSRAEARLAEDNLESAYAELAGLTGGAREKASEWMRAAGEKIASDRAIAQMSAASRQTLSGRGR